MSIQDDRDLRFDIALLFVFAGLLAYSILAWQNVFGLGPVWHPGQLIWLNVALFCQAIARMVRRSSRRIFYALTAVSVAALVVSVAAR